MWSNGKQGVFEWIVDQEIKELLQLELSSDFSEKKVSEKWRYAFLSALESSELSEQITLERLQILYADFNYPDDMQGCSIYANDGLDPLAEMHKVILKLGANLK